MQQPTFNDGDILIGEEFAIKVTRTARGWFAEVAESEHPCAGEYAFGDKWAVISMLVDKVRAMQTA